MKAKFDFWLRHSHLIIFARKEVFQRAQGKLYGIWTVLKSHLGNGVESTILAILSHLTIWPRSKRGEQHKPQQQTTWQQYATNRAAPKLRFCNEKYTPFDVRKFLRICLSNLFHLPLDFLTTRKEIKAISPLLLQQDI